MRRSLWCLLSGMALAGCGAAGTSSGNPSTTTASAVPSDLVLSSPTASTAVAASRSKGLRKATGDPTTSDYLSKQAALQALINAAGDCAFTLQLPTVTPPACYGPALTFSSHPEATTPDSNTTDNGADDDDGTLPTGDLGLWNTNEGSEACAAAQMNYVVDAVARRVDNFIKLFGVAICAQKKAGLSLPAVGETLNLATAMQTHAQVIGLTVTTLALGRQANTTGGHAVYHMTFTGTLGFAGNITKESQITLTHIPTAEDNSTYRGQLSIRQSNLAEGGMNCASVGATGSVDATTILYEKTAADNLIYLLNDAEFCGATTNPFDSQMNIAPSDKASLTNPEGWANNWDYGLFRFNPSAGTGVVAYAWQAGMNDQQARVLNVTTSAQTDGRITGTAYFGFGPEVAATSGLGTIDRFICNWAGPGGAITSQNYTGVAKVQRQGLVRATGGAAFTSVESDLAITYAPTTTCNTNSGFVYQSSDGSMTNDNASGTAVTNGLLDVSQLSFTMPTRPSDL